MPYFPPQLPVVSTPPMRDWQMLYLPWTGEVEVIHRIHMPNLIELYIDYSPVTSIPWQDLVNLQYLSLYYTALEVADLWKAPNLYNCYAYDNYELASADAHDLQNITDLSLEWSSQLSYLNVLGCPQLRWLYLRNCAFPEAVVDQILADLVTNGATNGYIDIRSGSNASPSTDGLASRAVLIDRGWTVHTQ